MKHKYSRIAETIPPSGIRKFFDLVMNAKDIISLGVGEPDFVTPWRIREEVYHTLELGKTCYTSNWGLLSLREKIAQYLGKKYNCDYNPENEIIITVGVSEAIDITLRALLNPGDEVIIPEPSFVAYSPLVSLAGAQPVTVDTSSVEFKVTAEQIKEKITANTKIIFLSYPNNPTGATIDRNELEKIALLAKQNDLWVISDEVYSELTYIGDHVSIASLEGMKERTIMFNGFSKAFAMTGWRMGYMCGPEDVVGIALKIHQYAMMCAPIMSQYAALEAIVNCQKEVDLMKRSYEQRRNLFISGMREIGFEINTPDGAFYAFPSIKSTGLSSEEFAMQLLNQEKVAVVPGNAFGTCGEGYIRCCYATDINLLKEAIKRIGNFVKSLG
ncbi:MAG: pyridoxal phosphate-dependent aminotransferase [Candidatus Margulisiibacteriota bacterium]|nr:MAG: aromatic amino acid aminotransferase [Candidatus Margulisbacteria bacterium GWD2_39_127]OGI02957.1 MAG: aromatic amino acid aminotransferase [Candidatus Margulisbacteria bacterium GWF2_38_17]OGI09450.1 MAG: aromatic amino acid aminotransferase [Candidatus Margulisbacteria bacterium GWE2_39_32]PZM78750.1 MAG: pyridoxal phosphate-dependent aminotransferase [Candidatus Margulisiibacteriota bacterium]HAR63348.1 pyridoxal phosphate-dependent aminotransferase [Candidatus Margulisiibacteriota 